MINYAESPDKIQKDQKKEEEMTIRELAQQVKAFESAHADTTGLVMEMNRRFSLPLASFIFALVGLHWECRSRDLRLLLGLVYP